MSVSIVASTSRRVLPKLEANRWRGSTMHCLRARLDPPFHRSVTIPRSHGRHRQLQNRSFVGGIPDDEISTKTSDNLLYKSPLGTVVTRLRTVSLVTGVCSGLGLPLIISLKGTDLPSTGLLATGIMFCMMTMGSTAAVHYVFHPYVYEIHRIPVRLCSYKAADKEGCPHEAVLSQPDTSATEAIKGPFLLKAVSKSLFLGETITVFDPSNDLAPYKGLRPMCNFTAKAVPLYVHPHLVENKELKDALHFLTKAPEESPPQDNPDDFL